MSARRRAGPAAALLAAIQFLTRFPVPSFAFDAETLPRALFFFPVVGAALGAITGAANTLLAGHLPRLVAAGFAVALLMAMTGALHEDALADCADAFGLRRPVDRTIAIMRDSRIGSFGAATLGISIVLRVSLIAALPMGKALPCMIAAATLARWSTLPLALLPAAQPELGQGATIAQRASRATLVLGTVLAVVIVAAALRLGAIPAGGAALIVTALTGVFYMRRLGGTTGDCFGATNQLVEIAVLTCGAWVM